jgi:hypothetical protein
MEGKTSKLLKIQSLSISAQKGRNLRAIAITITSTATG